MSPRPMRRYKTPVLICAVCSKAIIGEVRMVGTELMHPTCTNGTQRGMGLP